ncbi:MAG: 23S rRNA (uracil(1939)-C(5))-methyltransferase RlmD [Bacteroidota bacterium]
MRRVKPFTAEMELLDAASDGRAVARHNGQAIFVEGGVPGDIADVHVFRVQKKVPIGKITSLKQASSHRIDPQCVHFSDCSGCKWQHMSYDAQLHYKEKQVHDILQRIGKMDIGEALPILGVEGAPFYYRNKLEFSFSQRAWRTDKDLEHAESFDERVLGYHAPRVFDKVLNIDECLLMPGIVNDIRNAVRTFTRQEEIPFYNIRENTGLLRTLAFRSTKDGKQLMVALIIAEEKPDVINRIFTFLSETFPQITQLVWVCNPKVNSVYNDLPYHIWKGDPYLIETLGEFQFHIRPVSFFQTNPHQAEKLYQVIERFLTDTLPEGKAEHEMVYDLYCGTGSIGIFVSRLVKKIVGIEYIESAIEDAWENVRLNQLDESRFQFFAGDMKDILSIELEKGMGRPDVIIADPPRQGMENKVIKQLLRLAPEFIIYVSCKPATQARDMEKMSSLYELVKIQPVDMFPHTAHVENVALMKRRSEKNQNK